MSRPRPTSAAALPVGGVLVLLQLSRVSGNAWLILGAAACAGVLAAAFVLRPRLSSLAVLRTVSDRGVPGASVTCTVVVRNTGTRTTSPAVLHEPAGLLSACSVFVPALPPGAEASAAVIRTALRRGVEDRFVVRMTSTTPFGLVSAERELAGTGAVVVHPRRVAPGRGPLAGATPTAGAGTSSQPVAGVGTEVLGLRPWRPGDPARSLHARASARHGRAVVLERERETGTALVVLAGSPGGGPAWEDAVAAAAALATASVRQGLPPTLIASGLPGPRRPDELAVLDWFAAADRAGPLDASSVAAAVRAAGVGGTVALLASAESRDRSAAALRQSGVAVVVPAGGRDA